MMHTDKTALVLGATGGSGGAIANSLQRHGWQVRGLARNAATARDKTPGIDWIEGDSMVRDDVVRAASGSAVIVHAVNPPNYANWEQLVLPMIDNTIAAAKAAGGARIVLPGTIYNFDAAHSPVVDGASPQRPHSRKGKIRVELEARLERASAEAPALILRAGDYFGPGARSSWFSQAMVTPNKPVQAITNLASGGGHSWAYLPDLAEAAARLLDAAPTLAPFERVQFAGYYDQTGRDFIAAIERAIGRSVPVRRFPWWAMTLLSPFGGFPREAAEIAQHWRHPLRLDNRRLVELIGPEPHTALDSAVRTSLLDLGCLPAQTAGQPAIA